MVKYQPVIKQIDNFAVVKAGKKYNTFEGAVNAVNKMPINIFTQFKTVREVKR